MSQVKLTRKYNLRVLAVTDKWLKPNAINNKIKIKALKITTITTHPRDLVFPTNTVKEYMTCAMQK